MLCTVVVDAYRDQERRSIHRALDVLLPEHSPDWSRLGVYAYWNRDTHELLYVGLASDLPTRFAQHNGLVSHGGGNKRKQIDEYFRENEYLGFTIVIQAAAVAILAILNALDPTFGAQPEDIISIAEGQLIQMHKLRHGKRPSWNGVGGSVLGQRWSRESSAPLLDILSGRSQSLFVARHTLRRLAENETARRYEAAIHTARMRAVVDGHQLTGWPSNAPDPIGWIRQVLMVTAGHLLDDLSPSDDLIRSWLSRLSDQEANKRESMEQRLQLRELDGPRMSGEHEVIMRLLDGIFAEGIPPEDAQTIRELLTHGYLDDEPETPAAWLGKGGGSSS